MTTLYTPGQWRKLTGDLSQRSVQIMYENALLPVLIHELNVGDYFRQADYLWRFATPDLLVAVAQRVVMADEVQYIFSASSDGNTNVVPKIEDSVTVYVVEIEVQPIEARTLVLMERAWEQWVAETNPPGMLVKRETIRLETRAFFSDKLANVFDQMRKHANQSWVRREDGATFELVGLRAQLAAAESERDAAEANLRTLQTLL